MGQPERINFFSQLNDLRTRLDRVERRLLEINAELGPVADSELAEHHLWLPNSATPTTTAGGGFVYVQGGALKFKGGSGTDSSVASA